MTDSSVTKFKCLIVTFDLGLLSDEIVGAIKGYKTWAMLSESSYAIVTDSRPAEVYNALRQHVADQEDRLYVIPLRGPFAGQGSETVNQWLANNLT